MVSQVVSTVLLMALLSGVATVLGVGLSLILRKKKAHIVVGLGFSVGMMLVVAFLELIPKASLANSTLQAVIALVLGFMVLLLLNYIIPHIHIFEDMVKGAVARAAVLVSIGMILHDFPEGFALASSFFYSPSLGLIVAIAVVLHNIPEQFAATLPLVVARRRKLVLALIPALMLSAPLGALLGIVAVSVAPALNPLFLAFAAGAMIFVSMDELLPLARAYKKNHLFIFGIGLSMLVYLALKVLV